MCFSAQADLVGGVVIGAIGIDVVRHVHGRRDHALLAALPLLFAVHQLDEAFVWWGLQGHVPAGAGHVAAWIYLVIAFVLLPVYVPAAVLLLEPPGRRRLVIIPFVALGGLVSGALLGALIRGPVTAALGNYHISYHTALGPGLLIVSCYVVATCGPLIFSGYRHVALFGIVNLIAVGVLAPLTIDGFASLWCAWAALTSGAIAAHLRYGRPHRSTLHTVT